MNILFVWTSPFKKAGGVGRVTEILAEQFERKGHNVSYLSFSKGSSYTDNGIKQSFVPDHKNLRSRDNITFFRDLLKQLDTDIIINQTGISNPDVLKIINIAIEEEDLITKIKVFTVHHNCVKCLYEHFELVVKDNYRNNWFYPLLKLPFVFGFLKMRHKRKYNSIIQFLIENSERLVLLSDKFIPDLKVYLDEVPENGVAAILNPAPFDVVNSEAKKENRLVYVGRINFQQKRTDLLIPIWKELMNKNPEWELDVLGDGEALQELKKMAEKANLERIHFHGFKDPKPYLEKAKFFVMTSAFEGFGMVLVEAQAFGVVPVAFDCFSALSDILINNENGLVIEPMDISEYTTRLNMLMNDEKKRGTLSYNARNSIHKFSPDKIADQWLELFQG